MIGRLFLVPPNIIIQHRAQASLEKLPVNSLKTTILFNHYVSPIASLPAFKCVYGQVILNGCHFPPSNYFQHILSVTHSLQRSVVRMARPGNKNIQAKLVLVGDMGTGKTSLVLRFVKGQFFDHQESTIGAAFFTQILSLNEGTVKFDIWDTAGQERYHSLAPMYYRGAAAAVVVYDISNMDTYVRAKKWVQELQNQRQGNPNLVMALVANKSDLESKREVATEEGRNFSQEKGMFFIETSAKTTVNINELFYEIAKRLAKACPSQPTGMNLHNETQHNERSRFCCSG